MSDNATLENLAKLARLITMGQPLRGQAVGEAIDLCVIEWRNDKARIEELEMTLAFYGRCGHLGFDGGARARAALRGEEETP